MTEHTYPLELLRTELKLAMADQLVTLIDRFASKQELERFRADFAAHERDDEKHFREINEKLDTLIAEKEQRDGAKAERRGWLDSRRFTITTMIALGGALAAAILVAVFH